MSEETKIGIKLEEETKPIKKMCEKLMDAVNYELDKGIENIDTKELGEAIDMIKDLYEAKEKLVKSCYYKSVIEAMEEHDFEDEEEIMEDGRRGYRGQPRSQSGRFMSRGDGRRSNRGRGGRRGYETPMMMWDDMNYDDMEYMRDLDRETKNKMYYTDSSSRNNTGGMNNSSSQSNGMEGRSGMARKGYMESKETHKDNSSESKQAKMKELENYMKSMAEDLTEAIEGASPEERAMAKNKLSVLVQKM